MNHPINLNVSKLSLAEWCIAVLFETNQVELLYEISKNVDLPKTTRNVIKMCNYTKEKTPRLWKCTFHPPDNRNNSDLKNSDSKNLPDVLPCPPCPYREMICISKLVKNNTLLPLYVDRLMYILTKNWLAKHCLDIINFIDIYCNAKWNQEGIGSICNTLNFWLNLNRSHKHASYTTGFKYAFFEYHFDACKKMYTVSGVSIRCKRPKVIKYIISNFPTIYVYANPHYIMR